MPIDPKTIGGQIECLARLTGAPDSFVEQVRSLFLNKGIALEQAAEPYLRALEDAFRREETIRRTTGRARESIAELQKQFEKIGEAYRRQIHRLRRLSGAEEAAPTKDKSRPRATYRLSGRRRSLVTRPQKDIQGMVPGPKDVQ